MSRRHLFAAVCGGLVLLAAGAVLAESVAYTAPHVVATLEPATATLDGTAFVNQGLVGTGRLAADLHDFNGETLGSFSSLAIERKSWRRMADGSYAGVLYTQPDRGPNNVGGLPTTDYAARLNRFTFVFKPYTGAAALPPTTLQLQLTQAGGMLLRDATGKLFTGRDPQDGMVTRGGIAYPMPPAGDPGAGKISMDAEAVSFLADGSFYVGDEYGPTVYRFDAAGHQVGAIQAGPDVLPMVNGKLNFGADKDVPAGTTGRRGNQGMEGVSASPDGKRLFAVLQSGTLQDNPTDRAVRRNLTRVMVYDISVDRTPKTPMAEYVLELPVYNGSATGTGKASATAAQSECPFVCRTVLTTSIGVVSADASPPASPPAATCASGEYTCSGFRTRLTYSYVASCVAWNGTLRRSVVGYER